MPVVTNPIDIAYHLLCALRGQTDFGFDEGVNEAVDAGLLVMADDYDSYGLTEAGLRHYLAHREDLAADCLAEGYEDEIL